MINWTLNHPSSPPPKGPTLLVLMEPNRWDHSEPCSCADECLKPYPQLIRYGSLTGQYWGWRDVFTTQPIIGTFTHWTEVTLPVEQSPILRIAHSELLHNTVSNSPDTV